MKLTIYRAAGKENAAANIYYPVSRTVSTQEDFLEVLQKFVNRSKHKRIEKRIAVKEVVLEMAMTNNITLPEDLMQTIESLDDEKPVVLNQNTYNAPVGQVVERAEKIVCNE